MQVFSSVRLACDEALGGIRCRFYSPRRRRLSVWMLLLPVLLLGAGSSGASIENFETWDIGSEEADDEYGLDLFLSAFTPEWERDWRRLENGTRIALGCVTRERWEMLTQARLVREIDRRARFRYEMIQENRLGLDNQQHTFGVEIDAGVAWIGTYARPHANKERHDFGLTLGRSWDAGYKLGLGLTREEALNDFWTERSFIEERVRVDFLDPAWEWRLTGERRWSDKRRLSVAAVLLPGFERRIQPLPSRGEPDTLRALDGVHVILNASLDPRHDIDLDLRAAGKQARIANLPTDGGTGSDMRRLSWNLAARLTHPLHGKWQTAWGAQLRRQREQDVASGAGNYKLKVRQLMATVSFRRPLTTWLLAELGYAREDIDVVQTGDEATWRFTHGSRSEERATLAAEFSFRGVRVRLVETLEIDGESYDVVGVHDKSFVQIQAVF